MICDNKFFFNLGIRISEEDDLVNFVRNVSSIIIRKIYDLIGGITSWNVQLCSRISHTSIKVILSILVLKFFIEHLFYFFVGRVEVSYLRVESVGSLV